MRTQIERGSAAAIETPSVLSSSSIVCWVRYAATMHPLERNDVQIECLTDIQALVTGLTSIIEERQRILETKVNMEK